MITPRQALRQQLVHPELEANFMPFGVQPNLMPFGQELAIRAKEPVNQWLGGCALHWLEDVDPRSYIDEDSTW